MLALGLSTCALGVAGCTESVRAPTPSTPAVLKRSASAAAGAGSGEPLALGKESEAVPSASSNEPSVTPDSASDGVPLSPIAAPKAKDCSTEDATKLLAARASYRPRGEVIPQIIQGGEYAPIEAIRALYVAASGTTKLGEFGFEDHHDATAESSRILIAGSRKPAEVELSESRIKIGPRSFGDPRTILLFQTLERLLVDLGAQCTQQGVRGRHLGTRAYRDDVRVEFSYGPVVVMLEGASNGPTNPERLYVLDVVEAKDSLWASDRGASGR